MWKLAESSPPYLCKTKCPWKNFTWSGNPTGAPSRQTSFLRNLWRTGHARPGIASPPGSSTRSCPTYGRFQHLRVTVSLNPLGRRRLLLLSDAWSQESLWDWIPFSRSSYSTPGQLSNLGFATPHFLHAPTENFEDQGRALIVAIPKREKPLGDPKSYSLIPLFICPL